MAKRKMIAGTLRKMKVNDREFFERDRYGSLMATIARIQIETGFKFMYDINQDNKILVVRTK